MKESILSIIEKMLESSSPFQGIVSELIFVDSLGSLIAFLDVPSGKLLPDANESEEWWKGTTLENKTMSYSIPIGNQWLYSAPIYK